MTVKRYDPSKVRITFMGVDLEDSVVVAESGCERCGWLHPLEVSCEDAAVEDGRQFTWAANSDEVE